MKRSVYLGGLALLSSLLAVGVFAEDPVANQQKYPLSPTPVTLKVLAPDVGINGDYNTMQVFTDFEKKTNVKAVFSTVTVDSAKDKIPLIFASGDLPDVVYGQFFTWNAGKDFEFGSEGLLLPLNDLIEKNMPNLKTRFAQNPLLKKQMTAPDGKIYSLPLYYDARPNQTNPHKWYISKSVLAKVGKSVPTTPSELFETLKAIKAADPSKIPLSMILSGSITDGIDLVNLSGAWGVTENIQVVNGKVSLGFMADGFKESLKFWNKLYAQGLLDKESISQDYKLYQSKGAAGKFAAYVGDYREPGPKTFLSDYLPIPPLAGANGQKGWSVQIPQANPYFSMTKANKYPDITARWIDFNYADEGVKYFRAGIEGVTWKKTASGAVQYLKSSDGKKGEWEWICWTTPSPIAPGYQASNSYAEDLPPEEIALDNHAKTIYKPFGPKEQFNIPYVQKDDQDLVVPIKTTMDPYVEQMKAKFLTGAVSIDSGWADYVATLKKMGADRLVQVYQKMYDATYKK